MVEITTDYTDMANRKVIIAEKEALGWQMLRDEMLGDDADQPTMTWETVPTPRIPVIRTKSSLEVQVEDLGIRIERLENP